MYLLLIYFCFIFQLCFVCLFYTSMLTRSNYNETTSPERSTCKDRFILQRVETFRIKVKDIYIMDSFSTRNLNLKNTKLHIKPRWSNTLHLAPLEDLNGAPGKWDYNCPGGKHHICGVSLQQGWWAVWCVVWVAQYDCGNLTHTHRQQTNGLVSEDCEPLHWLIWTPDAVSASNV